MPYYVQPHGYYLSKHYAYSENTVHQRYLEILDKYGEEESFFKNTIMVGQTRYTMQNEFIYNTQPLSEYVFECRDGISKLKVLKNIAYLIIGLTKSILLFFII